MKKWIIKKLIVIIVLPAIPIGFVALLWDAGFRIGWNYALKSVKKMQELS